MVNPFGTTRRHAHGPGEGGQRLGRWGAVGNSPYGGFQSGGTPSILDWDVTHSQEKNHLFFLGTIYENLHISMIFFRYVSISYLGRYYPYIHYVYLYLYNVGKTM